VRALYERDVRPDPAGGERYRFLVETGAWTDPETARLLTAWAWHSIRRDPVGWGRAFTFAAQWQLGYFPSSGPITHSSSRWALWRLGQDGRDLGAEAANYQFTGDAGQVSRFAMHGSPGPQRHYFLRIASWRDIGLIHALFLVLAAAATIAAAFRRRWTIAAVFGGTIVYYGVHSLFLLPYDRFSFPCWIAWYTAPAAIILLARRTPLTACEEPTPVVAVDSSAPA
jgi:hypothetical protein